MQESIKKDPVFLIRKCSACQKTVKYTRQTKPKDCPYCSDYLWDKPTDERNLFLLQNKYIEGGRRSEDLGAMYPLIFNYARNVVINSVKFKVFLSEADIEEKSEDIAIILIEKYLKDSEYVIEHSFGAMLIMISKGVLYNKRVVAEDNNLSLEMQLDENFTLQDNPLHFILDSDAKEKYEKDAYAEYDKFLDTSLPNELSGIVDKIYDRVSSSQRRSKSLLFLVGMRNYFQGMKSGQTSILDDYYDYLADRETRLTIEKAKMFLRKYLMERMSE